MFLPIGDTPNPRGTPIITYLLIGINIAVFLLVSLPMMYGRPDLSDPVLLEYLRAIGARGRIPAEAILAHVTAYDVFVFTYGYRPSDPSATTMFTSMFLHGGWMHLIGNMLFLWIFGDNVEARLGHLRYLLAYLATGVAATLFFSFFVPGSQIPLIGASGAISGVLGLYFLWFPGNKVKTFVFLFPFIITTLLIPARLVLGFYLIVSNLLPFLMTGAEGAGVAHGAHIGGFLAGFGIAAAGNRLPLASSRKGREQEQGDDLPEGDTPADRVVRSLRLGNTGQATLRFLSLPDGDRRRISTSDLLQIGDYLLDRRDAHGALSIFRRIVAERPRDPALDRVFFSAGIAAKRLGATSAREYFLSAIDVARSEELAEAARQHLRTLEKH